MDRGIAVGLLAVTLASPRPDGETIMIDSTQLKVHRTAASLSIGGTTASHRTDQRRAEFEAAHATETFAWWLLSQGDCAY
jgi:hypothetical protein